MSKVQISGRTFLLTQEQVAEAVADVLPEPLLEHYVVIDGRRFPPKQVISEVTGLDRADFTTHQARRILLRLGFSAARRSAPEVQRRDDVPGQRRRGPHGGAQADALRPYVGRWVALRGDDEVLVAAASAREVVSWLSRHGRTADSIFRVPESDAAASGMAPL